MVKKILYLALLSAITWTGLILFSHSVIGTQFIEIPLGAINKAFVQVKPGLGISLFFVFHGALAIASLWIVNRHKFDWQSSPLLLNLALLFFVITSTHDVLVIHRVFSGGCCFLSEYSIVLVAIALFFNSQQDSAGLVDTTQHALHSSRQDFFSLLQSSLDFILIHQNNIIVFINDAGFKALGYDSPDQLVGRPAIEIVHPIDRENVIQRIKTLHDEQKTVPMIRERLLHKDGHAVMTEIIGTRILFQGKPAIMAIARDISQQLEFETRMMQVDRMVAIGTLAAGVAHEINNPLTFVAGNLELINENIEMMQNELGDKASLATQNLCNETVQMLKEATVGTDRIHATVQDLSALARDSEGQKYVQVCAAEVAQSALRLSRPQTKYRAVVHSEIEPNLYFLGNASKITQVLINLLVNAAQAIPLGNQAGNRIDLRAFSDAERVCFEISDTGSGIDDKVRDTLFDPFVTTKDVGEGTGLGLAISRQIVSDHCGEITVQTKSGEGSCFSVYLPMDISAPDDDKDKSRKTAQA